MRNRFPLVRCVAAIGPLVLFGGSAVRAQTPAFSGGLATWIHDPDVASGSDTTWKVSVNSPPTSASESSPPAFQLNRVNIGLPGSGGSPAADRSSAFGWVGHTECATQVGIKLGTGSGVTQTDANTAPNFGGASRLRLDIGQYNWTTNNLIAFGPTAQAYFSVALKCTIPTGSSGSFNASINFVNNAGAQILTAPISFSNKPLPVPSSNQIVTFTDQKLFNQAGLGKVAANQTIRMVGFVEFFAKNDFGPVDFTFDTFEISASPPTATFAASGVWTEPATWAPPPVTPDTSPDVPPGPDEIIPIVPNAANHRARFAGVFGPAVITVPTSVTINMLDVDGKNLGKAPGDTLSINREGAGTSSLIFDALTSPGSVPTAVIQVDHVYGNASVDMALPVVLNVPTDVINNSTGPVKFSQSVTGGTLSKSGTGPMLMNNASINTLNLNGGRTVLAGIGNSNVINVNAGAELAGTGQVTSPASGQVNVNSGGQISPGNLPGDTGTMAMFSLHLNGGTAIFDLSNTGSDQILVTGGGLALNGTSTINLNQAGSLAGLSSVQLIQYGGTLSGGGSLALASPTVGDFFATLLNPIATPGAIVVQLAPIPVVNTSWINPGPGNWSLPANWSAGQPNSINAIATFGNAITVPSQVIVDVPRTVGTMNFNHNLSYTIAGGAPITFDVGAGNAAINVNLGTHTISAPVILNNNLDVTVVGGSTLAMSGTIASGVSGTGLNVGGAGVLVLAGNNSFSGPVQIFQGTVRPGSNTAFGSASGGAVSVFDGAAIDLAGIPTTNFANFGVKQFNIVGSGVGGTGAITNTGANQQNAFQRVTLIDDATIGGSARIDLRGGTPQLNLAGHTLTKVGNSQFTLVGANVSDGNIVVNEGTLGLETTTVIGPGNGNITLNANTRLQFFNVAAPVSTIERTIVVNGAGVQIGNGSGTASVIASNIVLNDNLTVAMFNGGVGTGPLTLTGTVSEIGAGRTLTKTGPTFLILAGDNTYTGTTTIAEGTVQIGNGGTLGMPGSGPVVNNAALTLNRSDSFTLGNAISGSGNVFKIGTGTAALSGNNSYAGTTAVTAGTLRVNGTHTGGGAYSVSAGATIGGSGTIGSTVGLSPSASLAPGNSVGTLTIATLSLNTNNLDFEMDAGGVDRVNVTAAGGLLLAGVSTFNLSNLGGALPGTYTLIDYSGTALGDLSNFALGTTTLGSLGLALQNNTAGTSVDLLVTSIITSSSWITDGNGSWSVGANWSAGSPNSIDAIAVFGSAITAPRTVTVDVARTVGTMNFNSAQSYTIAGPAALTMDVSVGPAQINVLGGSHTIAASLVLNDDLTVTSAASTGVDMTAPINAPTRTVNKAGAGSVQFASVRAAALNVNAGTAKVSLKGTANSASGTSVVGSLTIGAGASLDLTNNSMVIDYSSVGTLVGEVRSHLRNNRLITSAVSPANTRLGYADNAGFSTPRSSFGGVSVDTSSVLIKFTYAGDSDLDGDADGVDIGTWATNFTGELSSGPTATRVWTQGDWDYDGDVDGVDAGLWATAFTGELSGGGLGAVVVYTANPEAASILQGLGLTVVPEPASLFGAFIVAAPALLSRRRRR